MPDAVVVSSVEELVAAASLETIETYSLEATRRLDAEPDEALEIEPDYTLFLDIKGDRAGFRIRFETRIDLGIGMIACGVLAKYTLEDVIVRKESGPAVSEFVNNVSIMHVLPYVRQAIADLTARVFGSPLLMPIIQRGEIEFQLAVE